MADTNLNDVNSLLPTDEKLKSLIAGVATILGFMAACVSLIKDYSERLGLDRPAVAGIVAALLLILSLIMKWSTIRSLLERFRLGVVHHISGIILTLSLAILGANVYLLLSVVGLSESSSRLATYSTTKFLGLFPGGMPSITQLIDSAHDSVDVLTDHVAFGALSDPDEFEKYRIALINAASTKSVTVIMFNKTHRDEAVSRQILSMEDPTSFFDPKADRWVRYNRRNNNVNVPKDQAEFLTLVDNKNNQVANSFINSKITVRDIDDIAPVFMWIIDKKTAAFSFHNKDGKEVTLATSDPQVVAMLNETFEQYKKVAKVHQ